MGPDNISALLRRARGSGLRAVDLAPTRTFFFGRLRGVVAFLVTGFFWLIFFDDVFLALDFLTELDFLVEVFFAAVFLSAVFFDAFFFEVAFFEVDFLEIDFLATAFFFAGAFFFESDFLAAGLLTFFAVFFLAPVFFAVFFFEPDLEEDALLFVVFLLTFLRDAGFFRDAALLPAGFLRAADFFFDDFFATTFFLLTLRFLPTGFLEATDLDLAADFREAFAGLRVLLAVFFAGISYSCRSEKNAQLYIACRDMEGLITGYSRAANASDHIVLLRAEYSAPKRPFLWGFTADSLTLSFVGDNRFIAEIALHSRYSFWRWANTSKCD